MVLTEFIFQCISFQVRAKITWINHLTNLFWNLFRKLNIQNHTEDESNEMKPRILVFTSFHPCCWSSPSYKHTWWCRCPPKSFCLHVTPHGVSSRAVKGKRQVKWPSMRLRSSSDGEWSAHTPAQVFSHTEFRISSDPVVSPEAACAQLGHLRCCSVQRQALAFLDTARPSSFQFLRPPLKLEAPVTAECSQIHQYVTLVSKVLQDEGKFPNEGTGLGQLFNNEGTETAGVPKVAGR